MFKIADIKDRNSLRDWLRDQPQLVSVWVAHRIAMRVLPMWWLYALKTFSTNKSELNALPVFYADLVSGVASNIPNSDISLAAINATNAAHSVGEANADNAAGAFAASSAAKTVTSDAESAATHAAYVAANAAYAAANSWKLIRADCEAIKEGVDLDHRPLWGAQKNQLENVWVAVKQQLSASSQSRSSETARASTDWSFWIKWYDDALAGTPPNWKMLERIALIDPKDWDKGAEVVNPLIAEIVAEFSVDEVISTRPYAKRVELNPSTQKLDYFPVEVQDIERIIKGIRAALNDFTKRCNADDSPNKMGEMMLAAYMPVIKDLRKDVSKHKNDALELFDALIRARNELGRIEKQEHFSASTVAGRLLDNLTGKGEDICIAVPEVLDTEKKRSAVRYTLYAQDQTKMAVWLGQGMLDDSQGALRVATGIALQTIGDDACTDKEKKSAWYFLESVLPRGAKVMRNERVREKEDDKRVLDRGSDVADKVIKIDKGLDAAEEIVTETVDWAAEVYTQISSGNWFGFGG